MILFFILGLMAVGTHYAGSISTRKLQLSSISPNDNCSVPPIELITVDSIKRLVEMCGFTPQTLIPALPPKMKQNLVIVSKSGSLFSKCIDPKNPRLLYFNKNTIIAIPWKLNTDLECNIMEVVGTAPYTPGLSTALIKFNEPPAKRIDATGRECAECHTSRFKPIWSSYPNWKFDDTEVVGFEHDGIRIASEEYENLKAFLQDAKAKNKLDWLDNRFTTLINNTSQLEMHELDFKIPLPYSFLASNNYGRHFGGVADQEKSPNQRFGFVIGELNAQRMADFIMLAVGKKGVLDFLRKFSFCSIPHDPDYSFQGFLSIHNLQPKMFKPLLDAAGLNETDFVMTREEIARQLPAYGNGLTSNLEYLLKYLLISVGVPETEFRLNLDIAGYVEYNDDLIGPFKNCRHTKDLLKNISF